MKTRNHTLWNLLALGFVFLGLVRGAAGQDLYKSRAEMLHAEAAAKQANASIISAVADYDKAQAEVSKIGQEIREKHAHNDLLEAETFYKKRAQYHTYQSAQRQNANSHSEYAARARNAATARLSAYQLETTQGKLIWPTLLKARPYDALRRQIDGLLKSRTPEDSGTGSQNCVETLTRIDALKDELRENIRRYSSTDYLAARNFVDAVAQEVQRPLTPAEETLDKVAGP